MKAVVSSLSEIPEALHGEYEEREGKYVLKLEGEVPGFVNAAEHRQLREKLSEFRNTNLSLIKRAKEIAGVDEMDGDLTPLGAMIEDMRKKLENASSSPDSKSMQELIQRAIKPLQEKLDKSETEREKEKQRANRATLRESIGLVLNKAGARQNAIDFLLDQGERVFEVKDDKVVARDGNFTELGEPVTPKDWVSRMVKDHDYAFESSTGGGAPPGPRNGSTLQPGARVLRNPTPQQLGENAKDIASGKVQIVND